MTGGPDAPPPPHGARDRVAPSDWDDAYANRPYVPGAEALIEALAADSADFRARLGDRARLDLAYAGPRGDARERFDLFLPEHPPRGLVAFIHGGYWMAFDRADWSALAAGPLARGWAVAMPSYTLAPDASIAEMTTQAAAFLEAAADEVDGPLVVSGHSAGGHLATRLASVDVPMRPDVRGRVARTVSISGVHDLRPLTFTALNGTLGLSAGDAAAESPALAWPLPGARVTAWVGADERPEFRRQAELLAVAWAGLGAHTRLVVEPGRHHFDVIAGLRDPDHALTRELIGE